MTTKSDIEKKTWKEFKDTGLLLFVNHFLHIFGWCIVIEANNDEIVNVYPARTKFRGFSETSTTKAYVALSEFMNNNSETLLNESKDEK